MSGAILIVDDSLTVRMDLADAFEAEGFEAIACASVAEAREALANRAVSAMVLDVLLPDGNGVDLIKEIRATESGAALPILMLSTEVEVKDRIRGLKTGADEYVGKPYDTGYVIARARELTRARVAQVEQRAAEVLLIDDSLTFRESLKSALSLAGYGVITAATGEEGLRAAATHRPKAIVVDGVLPGIDGATVIRRVRLDAALRRVPCVLLTASDDVRAELRALDAGADAFLRKEEDAEVIIARIAAVLRGARSGIEKHTESSLGPKKLLAVDDSPTYLDELASALRADGYDVVLARSGEEALDLLGVESVDCVLLDLLMPGLGGQETCRRIKSAPIVRDIPLIMLTALEDRSAMIGGLGAGADDYISKSSDFEVLRARVRAQLRRKHFEDENRKIREELLQKELEAQEARAARELAEMRAAMVQELERKNKELEAFSYSVSHDLRAPLRAIDGFGRALEEDCAALLDESGRDYLKRIRAATQRMGELIDDLLKLSRLARAEVVRQKVDVSRLGASVVADLLRREPDREAEVIVREGLTASCDVRLLRIVLENLLGNALKFSSKTPGARVELGCVARDGESVFFVRDNGAGFDSAHAKRLFQPFQRLHTETEFPGTGIGLATVERIVSRHEGRVWAASEVGCGATFFFTLGRERRGHEIEARSVDS